MMMEMVMAVSSILIMLMMTNNWDNFSNRYQDYKEDLDGVDFCAVDDNDDDGGDD